MQHAQNVTILNGPPGCGKDTLAGLIQPAAVGAFKDFLYYETAKHYSIYLDAFKEACANRALKELPYTCYESDRIIKSTPREMLINVSENIIKPKYGNNYFGKKAAEVWYGKCSPMVISDGGFYEEVQPICDTFGKENVLVIRLWREGFTFRNDSRNYILEQNVDCKVVDVVLHDGEIDAAVKHIEFLRERFL